MSNVYVKLGEVMPNGAPVEITFVYPSSVSEEYFEIGKVLKGDRLNGIISEAYNATLKAVEERGLISVSDVKEVWADEFEPLRKKIDFTKEYVIKNVIVDKSCSVKKNR